MGLLYERIQRRRKGVELYILKSRGKFAAKSAKNRRKGGNELFNIVGRPTRLDEYPRTRE
jgi:hypothetical protein